MIILCIKEGVRVQPIVIIDYTRSNDQFTEEEINKYSKKISSAADIKTATDSAETKTKKPIIYSLNYNYIYEHSGLNFGSALKTSFNATILNAPNDLVGLLRIKEIVSSQNLEILGDSLSRITDSEIVFPTGAIVIKTADGKDLTRPFTIYSTPFEPDRFRIDNKLRLIGAAYDDVVFRLELKADIKKDISLSDQIKNLFSNTNFRTRFNFSTTKKPAIGRYYPPAPLNVILQNICTDNKLTFKIVDLVYVFYSLDPKDPPKNNFKNKLSFSNFVSNTFLISNLTFNNYAIANIDCELFDLQLFDTIITYDDSNSQVFYNLNKIAELTKTVGGKPIYAYSFYVIRYTIIESRIATMLNVTASNNWLLNNIKVDALFEPAIYKELLK